MGSPVARTHQCAMVAGGSGSAYRQEPWRRRGCVLTGRETDRDARNQQAAVKIPPPRVATLLWCGALFMARAERTHMGRGAVRLLLCIGITIASVASASAGPREDRGRNKLGATEAAKVQPSEFGMSLATAARKQLSYF